jgi:D-lactate dehydrogenase
MTGFDVHGKTVGIVGLGRIGLAFAKRMKGFGCNLLYAGPSAKVSAVDGADHTVASHWD